MLSHVKTEAKQPLMSPRLRREGLLPQQRPEPPLHGIASPQLPPWATRFQEDQQQQLQQMHEQRAEGTATLEAAASPARPQVSALRRTCTLLNISSSRNTFAWM